MCQISIQQTGGNLFRIDIPFHAANYTGFRSAWQRCQRLNTFVTYHRIFINAVVGRAGCIYEGECLSGMCQKKVRPFSDKGIGSRKKDVRAVEVEEGGQGRAASGRGVELTTRPLSPFLSPLWILEPQVSFNPL